MPRPASTTLGALVARGARLFARAHLAFGHGLPGARDEALFLALHALKLPQTWAHALPPARKVSAADAARVMAWFERRIQERKPAMYLTREAWLAGKRFYVDERVIVPRSYIADILADGDMPVLPRAPQVKRALDLCTGSGCLAVLLARHYRSAQVDAADISADALEVAKINIRRHRLFERIKPVISDYFSTLGKKRYDLIISNPPYVASSVMRTLPPEYRAEPSIALAAGRDGLDAVRVILREAAQHLTPGGVLVVECGHARARVERTWPRLPFFWVQTSGGDDCVFVLTRDELTARSHRHATPPSRGERRV